MNNTTDIYIYAAKSLDVITRMLDIISRTQNDLYYINNNNVNTNSNINRNSRLNTNSRSTINSRSNRTTLPSRQFQRHSPFINLFNSDANSFWNTIPIYPTEEEIINAIEIVEYSESINGQNCPITMENFNENSRITKITLCGHIFNENALRRWFRNHTTCPICRIDIRDNVNTVTNNDANTTSSETATSNTAPETATPNTASPVTTTPNTAIETTTPNTATETVTPNTATETATPNTASSETATPNTANTETATPNTASANNQRIDRVDFVLDYPENGNEEINQEDIINNIQNFLTQGMNLSTSAYVSRNT